MKNMPMNTRKRFALNADKIFAGIVVVEQMCMKEVNTNLIICYVLNADMTFTKKIINI